MHKNNNGFSTPFLFIIAALIVIGIGTVGVMVYHSDRSMIHPGDHAIIASQTTSHDTRQTVSQKQATATTYLNITQWGVRLTLNSTTSSLYYYINPQQPNVAYLSLSSIDAVAPNCAADKTSLGAIVRLTPAEQKTAPNANFSIPGTIEIGDYWYGYGKSPSACTDGTAAMNEAVSNAAPPYYTGSTLQDTFNSLAAD
jgi:hypothetical protein